MKNLLLSVLIVVFSFLSFSCGEEKKDDDLYNTGENKKEDVVANPSFSKTGGAYQEELSIEITTETADAVIYFTIDGSVPDDSSTQYSEPISIPLETTMTIKAIAYKETFKPSAVISATYDVTGVLETPEFSISPGVYQEPKSISISHNDPEVVIRYTEDGTEPTAKSKIYSVPISIPTESDESTEDEFSIEIRAKAFRSKWGDSATLSGLFVITGTLKSPEFLTEPGTYTEAKMISLSCEDSKADIRYEVYGEDGGADPSEESTLYTQPFLVPLDTIVVVKARVFREGWNPSPVISGQFVVTGTVGLPVFEPVEGTYTSEQSVTMSISTEGAVVRYTIDGSEPTELSPLHSTPIAVPLDTQILIKAKGFKTDWNPSATVGGNYKVTGKVATPAFSIIPNYYTSTQNVAITTTTSGASIKFTVDGSEPSKTHGFEYTGAIEVGSTTTLKAFAYKTDWIDSDSIEGVYNITGQIQSPVFSPEGGNYTNVKTVTLTSSIPGATIRYTIDGSNPTRENGMIYSDPFTVSQTRTIKAIAYRNDWEISSDSSISSETYTITGRVVNPKFSIDPGNYTTSKSVTLSTETAGTVIRFTTNGTDPSRTEGDIYSSAIAVNSDTTIKAIAYKLDWEESSNSEIVSGAFNITGKVYKPEINPVTLNNTYDVLVSMASATPGALIKYTTNGLDPTRTLGELYDGPFTVTNTPGSTIDVRAIAYKSDWEATSNSDISTKIYTITGKVITPKFDTLPGNYTASKTVKITSETNGVIIRYTLDGTTPTRSYGDIYTATGVVIPETKTLKAIAYKTDWQESSDSDVITGAYNITGTVFAPEFAPATQHHTDNVLVSISSHTGGATIRYTVNGNDPTTSYGTIYEEPFTVSSTTTVKAIAYRDDWESTSKSTVSSKLYTITGIVPKPLFGSEPGYYTNALSLTITSTAGTKIMFTTDGSTPTRTNGTLYTAGISIPATRTVKAIAFNQDWQESSDSEVITGVYTITGKVYTPIMNPFTGNYTNNKNVTIETGTEDAIIRYTTNGTAPTRINGIVYTGPVQVTETTTLKAIAYKDEWQSTSDSDVVTGTITITGVVANPVFSIEPGNYTSATDVTISSATTGSTIIYTLNGTDPTRENGTQYSGKITISSTTTLKAFAYKTGWETSSDSNVVSALYTITGRVANPSISPDTQYHTDNVLVSIASITSGAVIRYTTDGNTPSMTLGNEYSEPFTVSSNATVKAIAFRNDWQESSKSDVVSKSYTITGRVVNPKFDVNPGNYTGTKTVKITTETTGAVIRYTLNGTTPTRTIGYLYQTAGVTISETATLKAIAYKTDWDESSNSDVISGLYTITGVVAAPSITPTGQYHTDNVEVTIASNTTGAVIRYTTDGTTNPTRDVGTVYENPFTVSSTSTIKAIAYKTDWETSSNSSVTSKSYTITGKTDKPVFSIEPGNYTNTVSVTLSSPTTGALIRYTIDGTEPTRLTGAAYTGAISIPSTRTVKAIAYKADWQTSSDSDISTGIFTITGKVINPVMTPSAGNYTEAKAVTITTETTGAAIRYSLDGSNPSRTNGTIYTGPVQIDSTKTLKAIAYKADWQDTSNSDVITGLYTITGKVVSPKFDVNPGNYTATKTVKITTETTGTTIRYTLNGTTPTRTIGDIYTTAGVTIAETATLKAIAYRTDWEESSNSDVVSGIYTITGVVAAPSITPTGQYHTEEVEITIASNTPGAVIRYTTDGTTNPTREVGTLFEDPFTISSTSTIKAIAYKTDWETSSNSSVTSKLYTMTGKTEKPNFSVAPGNYTNTVSLTLSSPTAGALIRFTDDGSIPTRLTGTLYTGTITISSTQTIKAIAYKAEWQTSSDSYVSTGLFTITGKAASPVMNPIAGNYTNATTVTLSTDTEGAVIRYTTNGTNPSRSNGSIYSEPFLMSTTATIKAIAYKTDWQETSDSDISSGLYTITGKVANPVITPQTGYYMSTKQVTIACATTGATIKYTLDGSDPSEINGFTYSAPFNVSSTGTVKAFAFKDDWQTSSDSQIVSETLTITGKVAAPAFNPASGKYTEGKSVTLTSTTQDISEDVIIRYTLDNSTPTRSSTLYTGPVLIPETKTLKAIAYVPQWEAAADSDVSTGSYEITGVVPAPVISPDGGESENSISVTISAIGGATIKYTIDGTDPSRSNGLSYTGTITLNQSCTFKAMAFVSDWETSSDSEIASATFRVFGNVAAPIFTPEPEPDPSTEPVYISMSSTTPGAKIRYTLDGTAPSTTTGTLFTGTPITISEPKTVRAIAYKEGMEADWTPSPVTEALYKMKVKTPVFSPGGNTYSNSLTIQMESATPETDIYYITVAPLINDAGFPQECPAPPQTCAHLGDPLLVCNSYNICINPTQMPDTSSTNSKSVQISSSLDLKARAYKRGGGEGWVASDVKSEFFNMKPGRPKFSVSDGIYSKAQNVKITSDVDGVYEIRYAKKEAMSKLSCILDFDQDLKKYTEPIFIQKTESYVAIVCKQIWSNSAIGESYIQIKASTPLIDPPTGTYEFPQTVTITSETPDNHNIYCTKDGSEPTKGEPSQRCNDPFEITEPSIIKAIAVKGDCIDSDIATEVLFGEPAEVTVSYPDSLQTAINNAVAPTVIKISCDTPPCIFEESLTMRNGVSLFGIIDEENEIIIQGSDYGINFNSTVSSLTFIENITVMGGGNATETKGVYIAANASPTIRNCIIDGGNGTGKTYGIFNNGRSPQIHNNKIYGGNGSESYSVYNENSTRPLIKENIIYGGDNNNSYGIYNLNTPAIIISNEIESGNSTISYSIFNDNSSNVKIFGNDIKGCSNNSLCSDSYGIYIHNNATVFIANNLIYGGSSSVSSFGIYNKSKDLIVSNNTISGGSAPTSYSIYNDRPSTSSDSLNIHIKNNILYTETSAAGTFCLYEKNSKSSFTIVKNNDFNNCATKLLKEGTNYIINISSVNSYDGMSNNISYDPFFTDFKPGQPLLESGLNLYNDYYFPIDRSGNPIDFEGTVRSSIDSDPWWIGAYENNI